MCNIAPVLTRTGVFYVVKTLVLQHREWQTSSEVADRPANELRGGRPGWRTTIKKIRRKQYEKHDRDSLAWPRRPGCQDS